MKSKASGLLLMLAAMGSASATEWSLAGSEGAAAPFEVGRVLADGNGYVLVEQDGSRWARIAADGAVQIGRPAQPLPLTEQGSPRRIDALGNDRFAIDALIDVGESERCRVAIVDGLGSPVVVGEYEPQGPSDARTCAQFGQLTHDAPPPPLDGGGGLWLHHDDAWSRMQRDGQIIEVAVPDDVVSLGAIAPRPQSAEAYALYDSSVGPRLARLSTSHIAWTRSIAHGGHILTTADGDALVLGRVPLPAGSDSLSVPLRLSRYAPDGQLRWERSLDSTLSFVRAMRLTAGGHLIIETRFLNSPTTVTALDNEGLPLWTRVGYQFAAFVAGPSGDPRQAPATLAFVADDADDAGVAIEFIDEDGDPITRLPASVDARDRAALLGDGSLVHAARHADGHWEVQHVGADGAQRAVPDLRQVLTTSPQLLGGATAADGASFTLRQLGNTLELAEIAADGSVRWRRPLDVVLRAPIVFGSDVSFETTSRRIDSNADRVCVGLVFSPGGRIESSPLQCLRRSDGSLLYSHSFASGVLGIPVSPPKVLDDGDVALVERFGTLAHEFSVSLVSSDGQSVSRRMMTTLRGEIAAVELDNTGAASLFVSRFEDGGIDIVEVGATGESRVLALGDVSLGKVLRGERLPDGGYVIRSHRPTEVILSGVGPDGASRWTRRQSANAPTASPPAFASVTSVNDGDRVLWAGQRIRNGRNHVVVEVLDAVSGDSHWQLQQQLHDDRGIGALAIDPSRGLALVARDRPGATVLTSYLLSEGDELGKRPLRCTDATACATKAVHVEADGSLRLFGAGADVRRLGIEKSLAAATIGQPAVLGTWFSPGTTGQGLFVDYSAQTGDLLAGWFTYTGTDTYSIDGLRWFTLSGSATPGSDVAGFSIDYNEGGQFDNPPVTVSQSVGTATLRMYSCSEAVLSYRFDDGEHAGLHGEIDLLRLTPSVFECSDNDGSALPAAGAAASADGTLEPGQSGAWFAPATSGQGLLIDLRPPSGDDDGLLVGGWFTYDPTDAADDPTTQHWFLLEGTLAQAQGGVVTVPVYRAIGGRFDQRPTANVQRVGEATLTFDGCSDATLAYRFDDSDIAGDFAGRQGSMALIKLLPCHR